MKINTKRALFINMGNSQGVLIHEKGLFRFVECSATQQTSTELLRWPELIRAARALGANADGNTESEFLKLMFDLTFDSTFRDLLAEDKPPFDGQSVRLQNPPRIAEFLLISLSSLSHGDAMVGDLNERFADECKKFGRQRAVRLYWARTLRSLRPLLGRAVSKALKWAAVIAAARRLTGL